MDGFRCAAYRQPRGKVTLHSRQQRPLTRCFPEVVAALQEQLICGVVLDGELVLCTDGRLDFAALHGVGVAQQLPGDGWSFAGCTGSPYSDIQRLAVSAKLPNVGHLSRLGYGYRSQPKTPAV